MNRDPKWDISNDWASVLNESTASAHRPPGIAAGSSYDFECSGWNDAGKCPQWVIDAFGYQGTAGACSWAQVKMHQQKAGNLKAGSTAGNLVSGAPFPASQFPIIRCFWHKHWPSVPHQSATMKVNAVALGFNVYWCSPYWEHDINPLFDTGGN
jgi:hypothetical protein